MIDFSQVLQAKLSASGNPSLSMIPLSTLGTANAVLAEIDALPVDTWNDEVLLAYWSAYQAAYKGLNKIQSEVGLQHQLGGLEIKKLFYQAAPDAFPLREGLFACTPVEVKPCWPGHPGVPPIFAAGRQAEWPDTLASLFSDFAASMIVLGAIEHGGLSVPVAPGSPGSPSADGGVSEGFTPRVTSDPGASSPSIASPRATLRSGFSPGIIGVGLAALAALFLFMRKK